MLELSFLERMILYFNPRQSARRLYARSLVDRFVRNYEASGNGRRWKGIKDNPNDAEKEVSIGHAKARNRARHLVRNNWMAGRAVDAIVANTVGHGIELSVKSKNAQKLWKDWARTKEIDSAGNLDFFGLQQLALGTIVEGGDVLIKKVRVKDGPVPIKIQLLEGDYIDANKFGTGANGNQIRNGIEFDRDGNVVAYWLYTVHPGSQSPFPSSATGQLSERFSTDDVRLVYKINRIGQVRGMTWFARVMLKMRDLDDYDDAQLYRQKIAACFAGFIETTDLPLNSDASSGAQDNPISDKMEPGILEVLPPGKKITFASPPGVGTDYDPFTKRQLQGIASGLGITYESLVGDYSNVNFSSGRMGWIEMHRNIEMWRWGMFIPMFCEVIWEWFVEAAEISGELDGRRIDYPVWNCPRREMIDPVKETEALKNQVRSGFTSYSESLREMGKDPEAHMKEMQQDFEKLDELGLTIEADPRFNPKEGASKSVEENNSGKSGTNQDE